MTTNYELAKKLKDAGFPQENITMSREGEDISYVDSGLIKPKDYTSISAKEFSEKQNRCYIPTLSELIKACGDSFRRLSKDGGIWITLGWSVDIKDIATAEDSPEEAVANLWLKINTK